MQTGNRHCQPFAVPNSGTAVATAPAYGLGGSPVGTFSIPFHPFEIRPLGEGLVARGDGHTIGEGKPACPNQDGTDSYQYGAKS